MLGGLSAEELWAEVQAMTGEGPSFTDIASSPYRAAIEDLAEAGVISGFADRTFRPESKVSRQQFAKMVVLSLGLPVSQSDRCPFGDVPTGLDVNDPLYPANYVAVCAANGITKGKTATRFAPWDDMTRAQLITMVSRAAGVADPPPYYSPSFADFSPDHYPWARKAEYAGLLDGLVGIGPYYDFFAPASRGEVAQLLSNLRTLLGGPLGPAIRIGMVSPLTGWLDQLGHR